MDDRSHTPVGAALGESGRKRPTGLGMATLMIGASFPEVEVAAVPLGASVELRRG